MTNEQITQAAKLWFAGLSTHEISVRLRLKEREIYARIEIIKDEAALLQRVA